MAPFGSKLKLLPSREVQESLLNCVEEGTKMVTSLVDGSLSEGQSRSFYFFFFFLITDFIALIAVNNLLDIQLLPSIPSC